MIAAMNMPKTLSIAIGLCMLIGFLGLLTWFTVRRLRRSEDPLGIIIKIIAMIVVVLVAYFGVMKDISTDGADRLILVIIGLIIGGIAAVLWTPHIAAAVAKPFMSLIDGGTQEVVPEPVYSVATARRKAGKFQEAIYEVQKQLQMFPTDMTGQMLLAEIQAEDLKDLQAADITIQRICNQPGHAPDSIALAISSLADWHLKYAQDREAARQVLERILELLPNTPQAQLAHQRIAHLASTENLLDVHDRATIRMQEGVQNVGLLKDPSTLRKPEENLAQKADELVQHLEKYPHDSDAREKLASIYAEHFQRIDLALMQLEELIQYPNQPAKDVVRWLNLAADLQIKRGDPYEDIRSTLERIIDLYPARAYADHARQRIEVLKLQMKGRETSQAIKLGSYEQNLGLKKKP